LIYDLYFTLRKMMDIEKFRAGTYKKGYKYPYFLRANVANNDDFALRKLFCNLDKLLL